MSAHMIATARRWLYGYAPYNFLASDFPPPTFLDFCLFYVLRLDNRLCIVILSALIPARWRWPMAQRRVTNLEALRFCQWASEQRNVVECIDWPFPKVSGGYGRVSYLGVRTSAHRVVLAMATGEMMPRHIDAAHAPIICHNPSCVNPAHLRWASKSENASDKMLDGTYRIFGRRITRRGMVGVAASKNKFRAYAYVECPIKKRRQVHLGTYETKEDAYAARICFDEKQAIQLSPA